MCGVINLRLINLKLITPFKDSWVNIMFSNVKVPPSCTNNVFLSIPKFIRVVFHNWGLYSNLSFFVQLI